MATPIITGYFRYTDIWFEWYQSIPNPEDQGALKAVLAHDALVHPDNPLRKPGVDGIELYMGTMNTGHSRLLFSSAQVDYVRYWLYAMKLTSCVIPMPYSDCMLIASDLRNVSPVVYKTGGDLRKSIKQIDKNNKRLRGANPTLNNRRDLFERVRSFWSEKVGVWCALDFEAWDHDHTLLTEFGWSLIWWKEGKEIQEDGHLVVGERRTYRNTYVPNHRENYNFGASEMVNKAYFKTRINSLISSISTPGPLFLVFHDKNQDIKYLTSKDIEAPITGLTHVLPDATPDTGLFVVDTADLFAALEGEGADEKRSLERVCRHLQIPTEYLHNAGNDAHYTLMAMKSMASGDPVDMQREKRWPKTDVKGVKVEFKPWEEDSDFSDQEGVMPPMSGHDLLPGQLRYDDYRMSDNEA